MSQQHGIFFFFACLFFSLRLFAGETSGSLSVSVTHPDTSPVVEGSLAFPYTELRTDDPESWRPIGISGGNKLGTRAAVDPETGEKVTEFWFHGTDPERRWINWQRDFPNALYRKNLEGLAVEVYPLTELPETLRVWLGLPLRVRDIGPAYQGMFGKLEPQKWNRLEFRKGSGRHLYPQGLRFVLDLSRDDVPLDTEVRFLARNFEILSSQERFTFPPSFSLETENPVRAAYLQLLSPEEVSGEEAVEFGLDVSIAEPTEAVLKIDVELGDPADLDSYRSDTVATQMVSLEAPVTKINLRYTTGTASVEEVRTGIRFRLHMTDADGNMLLRTVVAPEVVSYSETKFRQRLLELDERLQGLQERADLLVEQDIKVAEPSITLQTADLFLSTWIPDDYFEQKERSIALTLLEQVNTLLDKAETELDRRQAGEYHELLVKHPYNPEKPIEVRNGRLYQDGHSLLLFGPTLKFTPRFSIRDDSHYLPKLGFNVIAMETQPIVYQQPELLQKAQEVIKPLGLSAHLLFSTHYMDSLPQGMASHVMMPYDVLNPETQKVLTETYARLLEPLKNSEILDSVGTANEPGYRVYPLGENYEKGFQEWLRVTDSGDVAATNARWGTELESYEDVSLPEVFRQREINQAVSYDWQLYRNHFLGNHFGFMKDEVLKHVPGRMIWVKMYHHFGFDAIDPEVIYDRGSTIHNWSSIREPVYTDYTRGIASDVPVSCSEWKLVPGFSGSSLDADPNAGSILMFENYARGLSFGIVWKWFRRPWASKGDASTFTRYPTAVEAIARTSYRLQQLPEMFEAFSSLDGGRVGLLFDKASKLHQGTKTYVDDPVSGFKPLYYKLNQNSVGVRILHAGRFTDEDLKGRDLLAVGSTGHLSKTDLLRLTEWVTQGGTLWLSTPGLDRDPWGHLHPDGLSPLIAATRSVGTSKLGNGMVVVDPNWDGVDDFFTGPILVDTTTDEPVVKDAELRITRTPDGNPEWIYLLNRSSKPLTLTLQNAGEDWPLPKSARDIWNEHSFSSSLPVTLPAYSVAVYDCRPTQPETP